MACWIPSTQALLKQISSGWKRPLERAYQTACAYPTPSVTVRRPIQRAAHRLGSCMAGRYSHWTESNANGCAGVIAKTGQAVATTAFVGGVWRTLTRGLHSLERAAIAPGGAGRQTLHRELDAARGDRSLRPRGERSDRVLGLGLPASQPGRPNLPPVAPSPPEAPLGGSWKLLTGFREACTSKGSSSHSNSSSSSKAVRPSPARILSGV